MTWSPAQYTKFEAERTRPVRDLVAQLPEPGRFRTAIDLGCGPGNSTEVLHACLPGAVVTGLDSSPDMVASARARLPRLRFDVADIATWAGEPGAAADLVFANAALQWVPDHEVLIPALVRRVAPGGCLAVQVPDNLDEPCHRLMREVAADGAWATRLAGAGAVRGTRQSAGFYYAALRGAGAQVDIWRTTYFHRMERGAPDIVEWFRSTGLRPFLQSLDEAEREAFLHRYEQALQGAYPVLPDGAVLLPFPRLFFVASP